MMTVFCMVGFAQSAPVTAKKATLMGDNAQVKDVKTGQVLRVAKASKTITTVPNGTIQMRRTGTPSNSATPSGGSGTKKAVKGNTSNLKVNERYSNLIQRNDAKQEGTPQNTVKKQKRIVPQNAIILEKQ